MKKLFRDDSFNIGFFGGVFLVAWANYYSTSNFFDSAESNFIFELGFPFTFFRKIEGMDSITQIIHWGLLADIVFATIFSFLLGLTFKFVWSRISGNSLR